ncbi:crosslink repair DNA glycosylase YcaQ family protein [Propionimicrobium sp. PCR01-08-3]|uniref:winged helix-turn-helix domain-containing protein n=1 Tax=Propionimicrobium sp. PCR01-08-3 TaxID=3052086 RepID=UPI00255C9FCA|nr:crosslink repair DNA glycosylase YcaQ family protein [Propionimicrobium sp. PCR01-08-3]WIY82613.1 crosslink repair DNA glycosylase YcaQ family protein [Propionimicrobium sp. PCR01-08-3]
MRTISTAQARRIALAAQGFGRPRPQREVTIRDLQRLIDTVAQFQIDTINVVTRAHFMPAYSRLGPYDTALLDRCSQQAPRRLFEYWGHAASLIDVRLQPDLRFRMARASGEAWGRMRTVATEQPELVGQIRQEVALRGPVTARQIEYDEVRARDHWGWNWSTVKTVLEWLFWCGEVTSAYRNPQFERVFDLPSHVLPRPIIQTPTPDDDQAIRTLVARSIRALGVGSLGCIADYFRLTNAETSRALVGLADDGLVEKVQVECWAKPAWLWSAARIPRRIEARALLAPFDSMVFERRRLRSLFGFDYSIEIYVPEPKRRYGYYVYPFLLDDRFCARVDLKADRATGVLRVRSAWAEPDADAPRVARELAAELHTMAGWLGLSEVAVEPRGDLAAALAQVC